MTTFHAIPSKSMAHRLMICAFLAGAAGTVQCPELSRDMEATKACLEGLSTSHILPCGESGSTLRFLLPVAAALGVSCDFVMEGRLPQRPLFPLDRELESHGISLSRPKENILHVEGSLKPGNYTIPGNISSQFISGLLFALPLLDGDSTLTVEGTLESRPYVDMTLDSLRQFSVEISETDHVFHISPSTYRSPGLVVVEGDWSNAAFWLCAGAISQPVTVTGLNPRSLQGDKAIFDLLQQFGADCSQDGDAFTVQPGTLHGQVIDLSEIPDLAPILSVVAAFADGETRLTHAGRLRLKESDRVASILAMLHAMGAEATEEGDTICITGRSTLPGGTVSSFGDHRIAMAGAIAGLRCPVTVEGKDAVQKSYPRFWEEYGRL